MANRSLRWISLLGAFALLLSASGRAAAEEPEIEVKDGAGTSLVSGEGSVSFGTMAIGGLKTVTFTVKNTGDGPLIGLWGLVEGADSAAFAWTPAGVDQLAPGGSTTFSVAFVPGREGEHTARVRFLSSDADEGTFLINLTAEGAPRELAVKVEEIGGGEVHSNGPPLDFGAVEIGASVSRRFKLTNLGTTGLRQVYSTTDDPGYILAGGVRSGFLANFGVEEIPPGQSVEFTVSWSPQASGVRNASVNIIAAHLLNGPFRLKVQGEGTRHNPLQTKLTGLHFRMGEMSWYSTGDAILNVLQDRYSRTDIETLSRWRYSPPPEPIALAGVENGILPTSWGQVTYGSLLLFPSLTVTEDSFEPGFPTYPVSRVVAVSGVGSAKETLGSYSAVRFQDGSYLKNLTRKLAASDNVGMELWVRPESAPGRQCITQIGDDEAAGGFGLFLVDGVLHGRVGLQEFAATAPLTLEAWQHIALVLDDGTARLWVNGTAVGTLEEASLPDLVKGLGLGATVTGAEPFTGTVDEMRMFETAGDGFVAARDLLLTAKPHAVVDQSALDFGTTIAGVATSQSLNLTNAGPGWLVMQSAEFIGEDAADFEFWGVNDLELAALNQILSSQAPPQAFSGLRPQFQRNFRIKYNPTSSGPSTAILRLTTNDPDHPVFDIALNGTAEEARPEIEVTPPVMHWEMVTDMVITDFAITVRNKGSLPLTGLSISAVGPHAADIIFESEPTFPATIEPGASIGHRVQIRPAHSGARLATLLIHSNDADENPAQVQLVGRAAARVPEIQVLRTQGNSLSAEEVQTGGSMNFGPVMQGKSGGGQVFVVNLGWAQLSAGLSVEGPNASDFTFTEMRPMEPQVVGFTGTPPYTVVSALFSFKPGGMGTRTAVLRIQNTDADENPFEIHLTGEGTPSVPVLQMEQRGVALPSNQGFVRCGTGVIGGAPATATLQVRNVGEMPLTQFQAAFTGPQAAAFSAVVSPATLAPGAVGDLVVSFAPTAIGPQAAVLRLTSNDTVNPFEIEVGGTGAYGSQASLTPELPEGWVGTAMAQLPNGNVLMAGYVETGGVKQSRLREIRPDGTETGKYDRYGITNTIRAIAVDSGGRVLITGSFVAISYFDDPNAGFGTFGRVFRFNADGRFDHTFVAGQAANGLGFIGNALVALPDGKVLVGGEGILEDGVNLIRLNSDGSRDESFTLPAPNARVNALALQEDGKVVVGGDFTNYGQQEYQDTSGALTLSPSEKPLSGLFRLTTSGAVDSTFGNPGFHRVSALAVRGNRIAVGGMQRVWYTAEYYVGWEVPQPVLRDWNTASLLDLSGRTVAQDRLDALPTAVAVQPGDRMLVAPGKNESYPLEMRPVVALVQSTSQVRQMYGLRAAVGVGYAQLVPGEHGFAEVRHQSLEGTVNALLAQSDGKVLVAGGLTKALVKAKGSFVYLDQGSSLSWGGMPMDEKPLPPETTLRGFAQLDIDGFVHSVVPLANHSDGLSRLTMSMSQPSALLHMRTGVFATATVDGPHAADFTVQATLADPQTSESEAGAFFSIQFTPSGAGSRRAVLHLSHPDYDNTFDMVLEGSAEGDLPEGLVIVDPQSGAILQFKELADFGSVSVGQSKARNFLLRNDGSAALAAAVQIGVVGDTTSSFTLSAPVVNSLQPGASVPFKVTYKAQAGGFQTATLRVTTGEALPFDINLKGHGATVPALASAPPSHLIAEVGGPLTLQVAPVSAEQATCKWLRNGQVIPGATGMSLHIPNAKLADAGAYTAEIKTAAGKIVSPATKVSVINAAERRVLCGSVQPLVLTIETAGDGLTYEWKKNGVALPKEARIIGAKGKTLTLRNVVPADEGIYTCHVKAGTAQRAGGDSEVAYAALRGLAAVEQGYSWMVACEVDETLEASGEGGLWSIAGGPPGVKVDSGTGRLSGRPTRAGAFQMRTTLTHPSGTTSMIVPVQVAPLAASHTGGFVALLDRDPAVLNGTGGLLTLTVSTQGSLSGSLAFTVPGSLRKTALFTGALTVTGEETARASITIKPGGAEPPFALTVEFTGSDVTLKIGDETVGLGGPKAPREDTVAMRHVAFIPVTENAELLPTGFARVNSSEKGAVTVYGRLATTRGMRPFTLSTAHLKTSTAITSIPFYVVLAAGETTSGWLRPQNADPLAEQGRMGWNVPSADIELAFTLVGGAWTAPASGESLLGIDGQSNQLMFRLGAEATQELQLTAANRLLPANGGTPQQVGLMSARTQSWGASSIWPSPQQGGLLSRIGVSPFLGTLSGGTWSSYQGAVLPAGNVDGLFIPGLDRAVGIYTKIGPPSAGQPIMALPVSLELKAGE